MSGKKVETTEEQELEMVRLFTQERMRIIDIAKIFNVTVNVVDQRLKWHNITEKDRREFTVEQEKEILMRYVEKRQGIHEIIKVIKASYKRIKRFLIGNGVKIRDSGESHATILSEEDEREIVRLYIEQKWTGYDVSRKFKIRQEKVGEILLKHGHKKRKANDVNKIIQTKEQEDEILLRLQQGYKLQDIPASLSFKCGKDAVNDFVRKRFPCESRSMNERTKARYSPEIVEQLAKERSQMVSKRMMGKNSPRWGQPPCKRHSAGIHGWYKEANHFRSLKELSYIIYMEDAGIHWESGESKRFFIEYTDVDGKRKNYWPDFILESKIVEIKPSALQTHPHIIAKANAAIEYCGLNNWVYEMIDHEADLLKIKAAFNGGLIQFAKNSEKRFFGLLAKKKLL